MVEYRRRFTNSSSRCAPDARRRSGWACRSTLRSASPVRSEITQPGTLERLAVQRRRPLRRSRPSAAPFQAAGVAVDQAVAGGRPGCASSSSEPLDALDSCPIRWAWAKSAREDFLRRVVPGRRRRYAGPVARVLPVGGPAGGPGRACRPAPAPAQLLRARNATGSCACGRCGASPSLGARLQHGDQLRRSGAGSNPSRSSSPQPHLAVRSLFVLGRARRCQLTRPPATARLDGGTEDLRNVAGAAGRPGMEQRAPQLMMISRTSPPQLHTARRAGSSCCRRRWTTTARVHRRDHAAATTYEAIVSTVRFWPSGLSPAATTIFMTSSGSRSAGHCAVL